MRQTLCIVIAWIGFHIASFAQFRADSSVNEVDLIGVWQAKTPVMSSGFKALFRFYCNDTFVYVVDSYDELNPISSISGMYKIDSGVIEIRITEYTQLEDFAIEESSAGFQFGSFVINDGNLVTRKQNDTRYVPHEIDIIKSSVAAQKIIKLDSEKYYKLSPNPDDYKN